MIKNNQLTSYDKASTQVKRSAQILEEIDASKLDEIDREWLRVTIVEVRRMRHEFFHKAHQRFVAERAGAVKPGE